ncbi:expressed unknown protein [Seminavis robusta]|uniref:Uncharacterized protein n=1 Tax=Seminavis robusta TaxID=568900 RepID=A0A9N8E3K0_9STRA|nr:expressed unknown protein [Seminavis robusta]|eukprot:Sro465_g148660.1 n/a (77) ;mRNA; f:55109-55419
MSGKNPLFPVLWLILLVWVAWPVALFCAGIWIILQPFEACFQFIRKTNNFLEKLITWPRDCGKAIMDCSPNCPAPY